MALTTSASLALLLWPIVTLALFFAKPAAQATIWTLLGAQLLLPVGTALKLPGVPQFDKVAIGNLCALAGLLLFTKVHISFFRRFGLTEAFMVAFVVGPLLTSLANNDLVVLSNGIIPSLGLYDGLSAFTNQLIVLTPYVLGRSLFSVDRDIRQLFHGLLVSGLAYSLPLLFEIRFSPQLHGWVYGYFPSDFYQEVRAGGFRPVVFMGHGLLAAFYLMTTIVAATALWRARDGALGKKSALACAYLWMVLLLCKSLAATLYAGLIFPLIRFVSPRKQIVVAITLAIFAVGYPLLRALDLVPTQIMVDSARAVSDERAASLQTRFEQEKELLDRALMRPLLGWGRWGRNRIYNDDLEKDVSITDGHWIITFGQFGAFGFIAEFGLLLLAVLRSRKAIRLSQSHPQKIYIASLALLVSTNMVDLLPNSTLLPWTMFLAGSLLGRSEMSAARLQDTIETTQAASQRSGRALAIR